MESAATASVANRHNFVVVKYNLIPFTINTFQSFFGTCGSGSGARTPGVRFGRKSEARLRETRDAKRRKCTQICRKNDTSHEKSRIWHLSAGRNPPARSRSEPPVRPFPDTALTDGGNELFSADVDPDFRAGRMRPATLPGRAGRQFGDDAYRLPRGPKRRHLARRCRAAIAK